MNEWKQDKEAVRSLLTGRFQRTIDLQMPPLLATVSGVLSTKTSLVRYTDRELLRSL